MTEQSRIRKLVKAVFKLMDTEPSKRTLGAIAVISLASFGLGVAQGQANMEKTDTTFCDQLADDRLEHYPELEPYYNQSLETCVVPESLAENSSQYIEPPGTNNTTNSTNLTL